MDVNVSDCNLTSSVEFDAHQEHTVLMATVEKLCSEVNTITENSTTLLNMQERLSQKFQLQNMFVIQLNTFSEQLHLRIGAEFKEHLKYERR